MGRSGQIMILAALLLVGMLALAGLAVDGARLFQARHQLQHALDGAALAAASQFRLGRSDADLRQAAQDFLRAQGFAVTWVQIYTCSSPGPYAGELCTDPPRKLVRVDAGVRVPTTFLRVVGWDAVDLRGTATGEAASVDLVLIIDNSESMAHETPLVAVFPNPGEITCIPGSPTPETECAPPQKPHFCNPTDSCQPFRQVKDAAMELVGRMYFPYDRVAVVSFDRRATIHLDLQNGVDLATVQNRIRGLQVYDPAIDPPAAQRPTDGTACAGMDCTSGRCRLIYPYVPAPDADPRPCQSSNLQEALAAARFLLGTQGRSDALWAVVLLSDGAPNATMPVDTGGPMERRYGLCPKVNTSGPYWYWPPDPYYRPLCQDADFESRHPPNSPAYDPEDMALDEAEALARMNVVVFTIGYGRRLHALNVKPGGGRDPDLGEKFLRYVADITDGDPGNACLVRGDYFSPAAVWKPRGEPCSNYFFAPDANQLRRIFLTIAERIFTRLNR